ncbi:MAG: glycosyltransferase [Acidobacteriota bacterium]
MALMVNLACHLARRGHRVDLICTDRRTGSEHERRSCARLCEEQVGVFFMGRRPHHPGIGATAMLEWQIASSRYDIVHSHLPMPDAMVGLLRRLGPIRFAHVITVHNTYEPRLFPLGAFSRGANVAYCSVAARKRNPVQGKWATVIPNGIDVEAYRQAASARMETRRQLGISADAVVVIAAGRLVIQKNMALVIESAVRLHRQLQGKTVKFLICGEGPQRALLQSLVDSNRLQQVVHLLGNRTDLPQLFGASDIFLSTSHYEGMPLTVLEALAAGLPCVLSPIEEHYEIAGDMAACVFASKDALSIASALESLIDFPIGIDVIKQERSEAIGWYSMDRCAAAYEELYFAVCGAASRQRWPIASRWSRHPLGSNGGRGQESNGRS